MSMHPPQPDYPLRESEYQERLNNIQTLRSQGKLKQALDEILAFMQFRLELELLAELYWLLRSCTEASALASQIKRYLDFFFLDPCQSENFLEAFSRPTAEWQSLPTPEQLRLLNSYFSPSQPGARVSLCMVVRNEAELILPCLKSLEPVFDELVLVDTGSDDGTPERVRQAYPNAIILQEVWQNDFSIPRNRSFEAATGDWILLVDADNTLDPAAASRLRSFLDYAPIGLNIFCTQTYNLTVSPETDHVEVYRHIFPNRPELRFYGFGHPHPYHLHQPMHLKHLVLEGIWLLHTGYLNSQIVKHGKTEQRQLRLERGLKDPEHNYPHLWYQAANELLSRQPPQTDQALEHLEACWQASFDFAEHKPNLGWINASRSAISLAIFRTLHSQGRWPEMQQRYALYEPYNHFAEFDYIYASALLQLKQPELARRAALSSLDPHKRVQEPLNSTQSWPVFALLLQIALERQLLWQAISYARLLLSYKPDGQTSADSPNVRQVLSQLLKMAGFDQQGFLKALYRQSLQELQQQELELSSLLLAQQPLASLPNLPEQLAACLLNQGEYALARLLRRQSPAQATIPEGPDQTQEQGLLSLKPGALWRPLLRRVFSPRPDWQRLRQQAITDASLSQSAL